MVKIPGGTSRTGSDKHYPEEAPAHRVTVDAFSIDRTPVTNRQFKEFVRATGHVTFAEIAPDPKDYPGALPLVSIHFSRISKFLARFSKAGRIFARRTIAAATVLLRATRKPVDTSTSHVGFRCVIRERNGQ